MNVIQTKFLNIQAILKLIPLLQMKFDDDLTRFILAQQMKAISIDRANAFNIIDSIGKLLNIPIISEACQVIRADDQNLNNESDILILPDKFMIPNNDQNLVNYEERIDENDNLREPTTKVQSIIKRKREIIQILPDEILNLRFQFRNHNKLHQVI
ncbi:hypothetical protein TVAG_371050 [Trichomonas vaginalis G3]|uniref:Uncharacterized protein n=1 Tax=Trichomonas vaginalis (strain ATCC PRA-98 / G3) TaxID=412133 RepID=A2G6B9_TRIV3|nr:hypothetical protein TVAGG3_0753080 [Trichomonas vaginalis G3]EAX87294.1 hypothetical protein TVAG_371050 [Trichomonas vaginalis G3]KAI5512670.1 hypothetical protein TVAGG3_0753080 [Trichomonas vaginalis G3]|eukprot:XP_001300224.1 hypothetical protein [Trichomonas vaginalis G3]